MSEEKKGIIKIQRKMVSQGQLLLLHIQYWFYCIFFLNFW